MPDAGTGPGANGTLLAVVPIPGTGTSLAIVGYPVPAPGNVVFPAAISRAGLVREVWQRDFTADSRTVDVHVSRLRHKLGRPAAAAWSPSTASATSSARRSNR